MDTTRAVNMSLYNYHKPTTPNLEEFSSESVVFTNAIATAPWTLPSHASLFTGLPSSMHGATHGNTIERHGLPLQDHFVTLAEILTKNGYTTGAVVSNIVLAPVSGLNQGFDYYWWGSCRNSSLILRKLYV